MTRHDRDDFLTRAHQKEMETAAGRRGQYEPQRIELSQLKREILEVLQAIEESGITASPQLIADALAEQFADTEYEAKVQIYPVKWRISRYPGHLTLDSFVVQAEQDFEDLDGQKFNIFIGQAFLGT